MKTYMGKFSLKVIAVTLAVILLPCWGSALAYEDSQGISYDRPLPDKIVGIMPNDGVVNGGTNVIEYPYFNASVSAFSEKARDNEKRGVTSYSVGIALPDVNAPYVRESWDMAVKVWKEDHAGYKELIEAEKTQERQEKKEFVGLAGGYGYTQVYHRLEHDSHGNITGSYDIVDGEYECYYNDAFITVIVSNAASSSDILSLIQSALSASEGLYNSIKSGDSTPTPAPVPAPKLTAKPTSSAVTVNGYQVAFDAYNINGNNYFKLRDLANVLNVTSKRFEVEWDGSRNAIILTGGKPYTIVGGEMEDKGQGDKTPTPTSSTIYLDGIEVTFTAYNIEGNNYFKLRDIGQAFDFGVTWDGATNTIVIDTSIGYMPE